MLAAPAFQSWLEGEPLDIPRLLVAADGRPRHTIFTLAHLPEAERMFFVTLLLGAVETWMRQQTGTGSLRALLYFDEIFGYLPPVSNPPAKPYLLRLLKQARAFGVGLVLATQNPADIDYKALSNIGTWFVGKLATDQDKQRLLDGLATEDGLNRRELDDLISHLDKRVFLARNVHQSPPVRFHTRWAMNYLAGPLTREQIPALNRLVGAVPTAVMQELANPTNRASAVPAPEQTPRLTLPVGIREYFLPAEGAADDPVQYQPMLLAQAHITFRNRKYGVDTAVTRTLLTAVTDPDGRVPWADGAAASLDRDTLQTEPRPDASFAPLPPPLRDAAAMRRMQQDWADWLAQHSEVLVQANVQLGLYAAPDVPAGQFHQQCLEAVQPKIEVEMQKAAVPHDRQISALRQKITREQRELDEDQADLSHNKQKEALTHTKTVLGIFGRGRSKRIEQSHRQRRLTEKAASEVTESQETLAAMEQELSRLEAVKEQELAAVRQKWVAVAEGITAVPITPFKKILTWCCLRWPGCR
ncbi:MAG: hypothetical protein HC804_05505 [Anaerolineae bacterium]|nr:hypothetical protein [Anaerolineae bacterium]